MEQRKCKISVVSNSLFKAYEKLNEAIVDLERCPDADGLISIDELRKIRDAVFTMDYKLNKN